MVAAGVDGILSYVPLLKCLASTTLLVIRSVLHLQTTRSVFVIGPYNTGSERRGCTYPTDAKFEQTGSLCQVRNLNGRGKGPINNHLGVRIQTA